MPKQKREIKGGSCLQLCVGGGNGKGNFHQSCRRRPTAVSGFSPYFFRLPQRRIPQLCNFLFFSKLKPNLQLSFFAGPVFSTTPRLHGQVENVFWFGFSLPLPTLPGWENIFGCFSIMYTWFVLNLWASIANLENKCFPFCGR